MRFVDLLKLDKDEHPNSINVEQIKCAAPNTPFEVIKYFYSDHGRNLHFQSQYENIEIDKLKWEKRRVLASEIINCFYYEKFSRWINDVQKRSDKFKDDEWSCIDTRDVVVENWEKLHTWIVPPIFLSKKIVSNTNGYWLVEGHTRMGTLIGLVKNSIISPQSIHEIWFADYEK